MNATYNTHLISFAVQFLDNALNATLWSNPHMMSSKVMCLFYQRSSLIVSSCPLTTLQALKTFHGC